MRRQAFLVLTILLVSCQHSIQTNTPQEDTIINTENSVKYIVDEVDNEEVEEEEEERTFEYTIGQTIIIPQNDESLMIEEIDNLSPNLFKHTEKETICLGYNEEKETNYILLRKNDTTYTVLRRCFIKKDTYWHRMCQHPYVWMEGDSLLTTCEYNAILYHSHYLLTKDKFEHLMSEEENPNEEIDKEIEQALNEEDGLLYCALNLGVQYRGEALSYHIHEGLLILDKQIDKLLKKGEQSKVDTLIDTFEREYLGDLWTEEQLADWKKVKKKRSKK